jgi:hypothetical protein
VRGYQAEFPYNGNAPLNNFIKMFLLYRIFQGIALKKMPEMIGHQKIRTKGVSLPE